MTRTVPTRKALGAVAVSAVVFVAGAASAWSSPTRTTATTTTSKRTTSTSTTGLVPGPAPNSPASHYFVINGTVNAASDHEILGSSAFPNYVTGAVDNYYSMAHTHVDNAPFAQGTASPADTGPVGQTAAAGNFQQPQYADARWPGDQGKASYGSQGGPYAVATAGEYDATAEASVASSDLSGAGGAGGTGQLAVPKGFDSRLRSALAGWQAKWLDRLQPRTAKPALPTPKVNVPTPAGAVTTPSVPLGNATLPPSVTVPSPAPPSVPSGIVPKSTPSRSLQSSSSPDGATLLHSTSETVLDPKTKALVTSGESSLGRVSIGGGQIVLEGIHVTAQITNDGTPSDKESVSVASASIGGTPVTIDQDGVHVAGQGRDLPYKQASDALNTALKQAGIQIFLVAPEIVKGGSNGQSGTTTSPSPLPPIGSTTTDTTSTDTTSTDTTSTDTTSTDTTSTTSSTTGTCAPTSTTSTGGTDTTSTDTTSTAGTTTSSGPVVPIPTGTTSSGQGSTTGSSTDTTSSSEETVTATGVHVVFTQPVDTSGVPAQFAEHILGEVYVDSLAVPAGNLPTLGLGLSGSKSGPCGLTGRRSGKTKSGVTLKGGSSSTGGSTPAGSSSSSGSGSGFASGSGSTQPASGVLGGSASQSASGPTGNTVPTASTGFLSTLKKPQWLLIAYLAWQVLMLVTGVSVWHWYRGGTS